MTLEIDIAINDERWIEAIPDIEIYTHTTIEHVLTNQNIKNSEISIVLSNNPFIQDLNKTYRNKDKPTNVLSFPQNEPNMLGDIIISFETIKQESIEQQKEMKNHFTHMLVHGCLHLLDYDHECDKDAKIMEALEISILHDLSIKNPYETL